MTSISPADAATVLWGADILEAAAPTYDQCKIEVPKAGLIRRVWTKLRISPTPGSGETVNHFIRINDTTDVAINNYAWSAAQVDNVTQLSQLVNAGDFIALKAVCPTWVTNPVGVRLISVFYIEQI